jgi:hypothetical protein
MTLFQIHTVRISCEFDGCKESDEIGSMQDGLAMLDGERPTEHAFRYFEARGWNVQPTTYCPFHSGGICL